MNAPKNEARREFLRKFQYVLAGGAAMSMLPQLELLGRAMAATPAGIGDGYRALVCVFLLGGNDSFNMLIPYPQVEYDLYRNSRGGIYDPASNSQGLAIARDQLLPLTGSDGSKWGLNPAMPGIKTLFDGGELAFLANVGTLVEPVTKAQLINKTKRLPMNLYSHNDQQRLWMRGHSETKNLGFGWGGMLADRIRSPAMTALPALPPTISIAGTNLFQNGQITTAYGMGTTGPAQPRAFAGSGNADSIRREALAALIRQDYVPILQSQYGVVGESALALGDALGKALLPTNGGDITTTFPTGNVLADQLRMVARTIKVSRSPAINHHRQIFYVTLGGFDTHDNQMSKQPDLLKKVSEALLAFRNALVEIGALNDVVTFTASDFGRTLNSNGNGSDHAWGGVQMVMGGAQANGGAVAGRQVWGRYPLLEIDGEQTIERGRVIPTLSTHQMGTTMAKWMGASDADLDAIFPGIENFGAARTLGFVT